MTLPRLPGYAVSKRPAGQACREVSGGADADSGGAVADPERLKELLRQSPFFAETMALAKEAKMQGLLGSLPKTADVEDTLDYSLESFFITQGITIVALENCTTPNERKFQAKLNELRVAYRTKKSELQEQLHKLEKKTRELLEAQSTYRLVTVDEVDAKVARRRTIIEGAILAVRQRACETVLILVKKYGATSKTRAVTPDASRILNNWFTSHIDNPYPTDSEKAILCAQTNISTTQLNNWFGNKRCRRKRQGSGVSSEEEVTEDGSDHDIPPSATDATISAQGTSFSLSDSASIPPVHVQMESPPDMGYDPSDGGPVHAPLASGYFDMLSADHVGCPMGDEMLTHPILSMSQMINLFMEPLH